MYDPTILQIPTSTLLKFAELLFIPTLGFTFLYLVGIPLSKLPVIDVEDYKPPQWVLPIFALSSLFLITSITTAVGVAHLHRQAPSNNQFKKQFHRTINIDNTKYIGPIDDLSIAVDHYGGDNNFRIFANGYRLFGSASHCRLNYQCSRVEGADVTKEKLDTLRRYLIKARSYFRPWSHHRLPHYVSARHYLIQNDNFIDIHAENAGLGECNIRIRLLFMLNKKSVLTKTVIIGPEAALNQSKPPPNEVLLSESDLGENKVIKASANIDETFSFYAIASEDETPVQPYLTNGGLVAYRLCERIRINFKLADPPEGRTDASWKDSMKEALRKEQCGVAPDRRGCSK